MPAGAFPFAGLAGAMGAAAGCAAGAAVGAAKGAGVGDAARFAVGAAVRAAVAAAEDAALVAARFDGAVAFAVPRCRVLPLQENSSGGAKLVLSPKPTGRRIVCNHTWSRNN